MGALDESSNLSPKEKARDVDMGYREVCSGALRLLAAIWARFPAAADYAPFWPRFFAAAAPLLPRMLVEVCWNDPQRCKAYCVSTDWQGLHLQGSAFS